MFKNKKIAEMINPIDLGIVILIILFVLGLFLVKTNRHVTSSKIIKDYAPVEFDVSIKDVKITTDKKLFKKNEKAFLTIRNVPYTSLEIISVKKHPYKIISSNNEAINDPAHPDIYEFLVTLKDNAHITQDGAVIGGNKIKIGLPVTIEGFDYKFLGYVSSLKILSQKNKQD